MEGDRNLAPYLFHQGTNYHAYDYLGCNRLPSKDGYRYVFRVWAPSADSVSLVSDFTGWDTPRRMERVTEMGVWETTVESDVSLEKEPYKFRIRRGGREFDKGDPYARFSRGGADGASLIFTESAHRWHDAQWMRKRKKTVLPKNGSYLSSPVNIYEVHLGSFIRHEEDNRPYSYREFADVIVPYIKYMGYTHVEFLPLMEFPYDGSWGYQVCGFYAPTSRYGDPDDFRYMIDKLHSNGIGVILDWVPAHFPKDAWGLYEFDGSPLYEYQGKDRQESRSWGTRFFDLGREEVQSFLISNAFYLLREFHIDGLRVDAVASMLYLDYDRDQGEWVPNIYGDNKNLEAIAFFRKLNTALFAQQPDILMIAEESTAYAGITKPVSDGGLGFNLKWNMGFANDIYDYVAMDPVYRRFHHAALTFPIMYAFSENFVLPVSHDEVVHGKKSFIDKMFGSYEDKFRQARTLCMMFMTYPGKKLMFMGTEYAQFREWDYASSLEWFMLDYPMHRGFRQYVAALNSFYLAHSELWESDFSDDGFEWILPDESSKSTVVFRRKNRKGGSLVVALNFSGAEQTLNFSAPTENRYECIFQTGDYPDSKFSITACRLQGITYRQLTVPALSGAIYTEKKGAKKHMRTGENNVF